MDIGLTGKEKQIFDVICAYVAESKSPSVREICEKTGIRSVSTVWRCLNSLEEKELIAISRNTARGISLLLGDGSVTVNLPVISDLDPITGKVTAGQNYLPFSLPKKIKDRCYAFVATGNIAEIKIGDTVVFVSADIIPDGYLAAVRTGKGLKTGAVFHRTEGMFVLIDGMEYRVGGEADIAIVGRIIGFVRKFL